MWGGGCCKSDRASCHCGRGTLPLLRKFDGLELFHFSLHPFPLLLHTLTLPLPLSAPPPPPPPPQGLLEMNLVPEEWGGNTPMVAVSAKKGTGIDELLQTVAWVAEEQSLVANPNKLAAGTVIEAHLDKKRGAVATLLVQAGTLRVGDVVCAGEVGGGQGGKGRGGAGGCRRGQEREGERGGEGQGEAGEVRPGQGAWKGRGGGGRRGRAKSSTWQGGWSW